MERYKKLKSESSNVKKDAESKKPPAGPQYLGDVALEQLKKFTGQDFGKDQVAWKKWIEKNVEK